jgi:nucleoid-associated protein YgaU
MRSVPSKETKAEKTYYTVRESGTLMDIAGRGAVYGDDLKWPTLFRHSSGFICGSISSSL